MYEIRKIYESEELKDVVSYPLQDEGPNPGDGYISKGYGIYQYQEDGTQLHVHGKDFTFLQDAVIHLNNLLFKDQVRPASPDPKSRPKPTENGTIDLRKAALDTLHDLNKEQKKFDRMGKKLREEGADEWLIYNYYIQHELNSMAIDTLTKWIEENYYPI